MKSIHYTIQHLQTKHVNEWKLYEEEKKAQEESRKKKCKTSNQPTITDVVERRSEYPSKLNYDICQLYEASISDNQHILCLYGNRDIC